MFTLTVTAGTGPALEIDIATDGDIQPEEILGALQTEAPARFSDAEHLLTVAMREFHRTTVGVRKGYIRKPEGWPKYQTCTRTAEQCQIPGTVTIIESEARP